MLSLDPISQADIIKAFNNTSRYLDDIFNLDNPFFDGLIASIYPKELKLKLCYKYKKPIRNTIFNYNKIVADLGIDDNITDSCDCSSSKFCYAPVGHIITGDFSIIKDKRLRILLSKGPKYRLP